VGHLGLLNLLKSGGDVSTLVQGSEEVGLGGIRGGSRGGGGGRLGGSSSSSSGGGGGRGGSRGGGLPTLGVPDQAGGVVLLDEVGQVVEDDGEGLGPGLVGIITLLKHTVGVELGGILHLGDIGSGLGSLI